MGTIFTRDWTGTNGDPWTTVDFSKVVGGSYAPLIQSGRGWGPSTSGTELIYRVTGYPQQTNYKAFVDATWKNASGAGRYVGVALRATSDGNCYSCEMDSNVGTTRVRIRRRIGGSWTTVSAWASPSGAPNSTALNAGVTLEARVENTDVDEVTVSLIYGSTTLASYVDTSASRIESGGTVGIVLDANWQDDDIYLDNLIAKDFGDEWSGAGSLSSDVSLIVDGTHYSWDDLKAEGILVGTVRQSYTDSEVAQLTATWQFGAESSILYPGAVVTVALDGTVVAFGRLQQASEPLDTEEGHTYTLVGSLGLAADVPISDPDWQGGTVRFNLDPDNEEYDSARADLELGEIIAWVIDNHLEGDGGLRDQLAAPPDGAAYDSSDLTPLDAVIPAIQIQGDVRSAIESLLSYTDYAAWINPDTRKWEFHQRNAGGASPTQVDLATDHVTGSAGVDPGRNYTAVLVRGNRPETTTTKLSNATGGGLDKGWETSLESTHSWQDQHKNRDSGSVSSTGTSGSYITMTPTGMTMESKEWVKCIVEFTSGAEDGNTYSARDNSGTTFTLDATSWQSGGPAASDTFVVYGGKSSGGRDNGHRILGRRFTLSDTNKAIASDPCATAYIVEGNIKTPVKFTYQNGDGTDPAEVELDLPAIGLINRMTTADPCTDGDTSSLTVATVEIEVPTYDLTSPYVPEYRYPTNGYYGTAYTVDNSKWSGGGKPGRGDPAVMRTYVLALPEYRGGTSQDAEMAKLAAMILRVLSPLAREAQVTIADSLDTSWAGLDQRLQVTETGGDTGDWASLTDLGVLAVEWDPLANTTTVYAGTQASGPFDVQAMRRQINLKTWQDRQQALSQQMDQIQQCIAGAPKGAGEVGQVPPSQLCAEQVTYKGHGDLGAALQNSESCQPAAPPGTSPCTKECAGSRPITNVTQAGANAGVFQGAHGGARVVDFLPPGSTVNGAAGENHIRDIVCCLMEHVQALWLSDEVIASAVNDVGKVVSDQLVLICDQLNALRTAVLQIQTCLTSSVAAGSGVSCPITVPGAITGCDTCPDYCSTSIPSSPCSPNTPP